MDQTPIIEKLLDKSPDTRLERLAKNFRNMGVVSRVEATPVEVRHLPGRPAYEGEWLTVDTTERGVNFTNVREKGWDFNVEDVTPSPDTDGVRCRIHLLGAE